MIVNREFILKVVTSEGPLGDRISCNESIEYISREMPSKFDFLEFKKTISALSEEWKRDFDLYLSSYSVLKLFEDGGFCKIVEPSSFKVDDKIFSSVSEAESYKKKLTEDVLLKKMEQVHITAFKDVSIGLGDFKQIIKFDSLKDLDQNTDFEVTCCNGNKKRLGNKSDLNKHLNSLKRTYRREINKEIAIKRLLTDEENIFEVWVDLEE